MKTTLKQITAGTFIALLLLVGNANAAKIKASSHEILESSLQLESWMIDDSIWNAEFAIVNEYELEAETDLQLENWMTNTDSWSFENRMIEETEVELQLEDWMLDENTWNTENVVVDPKLTVEAWMLDEKNWK